MITTTNPRTELTAPTGVDQTSEDEVAAIAARAHEASPGLLALGRYRRADLLDAIADEVEANRDQLVETADGETGLGMARLHGELSRSIFQFRLFGEAVREGSYLEASIDHAAETPLGPGPDLRRTLLPIGPVAVFGASNFPFAFSVLGGDTASAVAAGCPVVLKAHGSHPLTSLGSFEVLRTAAERVDAPEGTFGLVLGQRSGRDLVTHPAIKAVSLTGSVSAARALQDAISTRDEPIPLYGELSSLNPLVITAQAAGARTDSIADGLFASFTGSGGQLCTKPGIAFVPEGREGGAVIAALENRVERAEGTILLNRRIHESFHEIRDRLIAAGAQVSAQAPGTAEGALGFSASPVLLRVAARDMSAPLTEECFGPLMIVATYRSLDELVDAFALLPPSLTASIHSEHDEINLTRRLSELLVPLSGRLVYNGYPTGVRVSWAQHHGGQWPSTNSNHTSVGVTSMRRFLRPHVWQSAPQEVLPEELRDDCPRIPRRIDGELRLPTGVGQS